MADGLLSVVLQHLDSLLLQRIEEEVRLVKDVKGDVSKLQHNLIAIQEVLKDAEKKQLSDTNVKNWLEQLKDVSHDMDDVLDEWNSHVLKIQIEKEGDDEQAPNENKKVCFPGIPSPFSCFKSKVTKLTLHHGIAHKIKELNEKLDVIATDRNKYNFNTTTVDRPVERPKSTSLVDETELFGRDVDKETLVSMLLAESSMCQDKRLAVVAIVGMGGLGKTTLAQLAYNDEKVLANFEKLIWVCVSDPFDELKVANAIIESIEGSAPYIKELNTSLNRIVACVQGKRFLLILDDVWTEDSAKWEELKKPLKQGAAGSRVLVTTRKQEVATMMGVASNCMILLEGLSEESCWLVFKQLAFFGRTEEECRELEETGRKIASKCGGLPLVAKTLGSLLRTKKSETDWHDVLHSELWELKNFDKIYAPFLLSYYDLSAKEKRCFSYCSMFPKDHRIMKESLIKMWMSQNYISSVEEGCECFDTLVMRCFFQNFEKLVWDGSITHCKMHDIVHDFARFLTKDECINLEVDGVEGKILKQLDEKTHHLTLAFGSDAKFPTTLYHSEMKKRNLRTLYIVSSRSEVDFSLLLQLTCLRSLTLSECGIKILPASIGKLKHLRHLDLSYNFKLEELPDSLCDLCNLQTLDVSNCLAFCRLPKGMGKLVNLRHLYILCCYALEGLPKGIGKLRFLRSFDALIVPENKEAFFDVGDFKSLENLRLKGEFEIKGCRNLGGRDGAEKVNLKNISQHFNYLRLSFGEKGRLEEDSAILEGLEPHQNLRSLSIEGCMGPTLSPRWIMSLINLTHIYLHECSNCEALPSLGKLPLLKSIAVGGMDSVKKVGLEFLGITEKEFHEEGEIASSSSTVTLFPKLQQLEFYSMRDWEEWEGIANIAAAEAGTSSRSSRLIITIMPCLTYLGFEECPSLQVLPDFLETTTSLNELVIYDSLPELCQQKTGKEWAKISHVPNIKL